MTSPEPAGPPPTTRRRGRMVGTVVAAVAGGAIVAVLAFWGLSALVGLRHDAAAFGAAFAVSERDQAAAAHEARMRGLDGVAARLDEVVGLQQFADDGSAEATALAGLVARLDETVAADETVGAPAGEAGAPGAEDAPVGKATTPSDDSPGYRPPWELLAGAETLDDQADSALAARAQLVTLTEEGAALDDELRAAEDAYWESLAVRAENGIAEHPLSTKATQVAVTRVIEQVRDRGSADAHDASLVAEVSAGLQALADSQSAEQAELDDPALATRREIEAYARSLSNGITLDFVWAPEVNGRGEGWLSGTAQTWDSDGGWAIISLNYGIEEEWGYTENPRALVAHEVGHTQVFREGCWPLFSGPVFGQDDEMWATAWSISQGFDLPGSGIEAYGRPSDEQIAVAGQCR
ncbi:hypothetical protein [Herbiconiux sp. A18JL235]|uniref:Uncharacterized protein n=1 Tax=Herbiconiux sp. A18JL235 TaxID=3152363 RepID=A0AB39BIN9_9MICO